MSWLASLWIVKFKRSIYTCRHGIRCSHYKHTSCLHPIEEVYIHEWCHYWRNQKKNKKRNVFMERWNEMERCRDPIVMCSAKMVNRAIYGANRCCRSQRKNRFRPAFVLILVSLIRYDYVLKLLQISLRNKSRRPRINDSLNRSSSKIERSMLSLSIYASPLSLIYEDL